MNSSLWIPSLFFVAGGVIVMVLFGRKHPYTRKARISLLVGLAIAGLIMGLLQTYLPRDTMPFAAMLIATALLPILWYGQRRTEQQTNNKQDAP